MKNNVKAYRKTITFIRPPTYHILDNQVMLGGYYMLFEILPTWIWILFYLFIVLTMGNH